MAGANGNYSRVVTSPRGYSHSMSDVPLNRQADGENGRGTVKKSRDRGDPTWVQDLVNYYERRLRKHLHWWDAVDDEYDLQKNESSGDTSIIDEVRPGRVYNLVHTIESMAFNRRPKIFMRGWNAKVQEDWIPVMEEVLNAEWYDEPTLPREVRLCVRDCAKYGWGIMLTTYDAEFEERVATFEEQVATADPEAVESPLMDSASAAAEGDMAAEIAEMTPSEEEIGTFEQDARVVFDSINSRRVDPRLFMIDPDATCIEDAKWVGRKIISDLEAVREFFSDHPRAAELSGTDRADIDYPASRGKRDENSPYEYVTLYEVWERQNGGSWQYRLTPKGHDFHLKTDTDIFHAGQPFQLLRWNETGDEIFAQSDIRPAWTLIKLECLLLTKVADGYTREHEDTYLFDKQAGLSEEELNAVNDPGVAKYVPVTNVGSRRLSDIIHKLPKDPKSPEVLQLLSIVERELQVATGLGPNQFGQALRSGTSASESMEVAGFARARGGHKTGAVEEFVAAIATFRLGLMVQFYEAERVARIAGADAASEWVEIKRKLDHKGEIQRGMRARVEQGSLKPENDEMRLQQLYSLLQTVSSNPALMITVNTNAILEDIATHMGHHRKSKYVSSADQQKVADAQAAMMMMQNGMGGGGSAPKAAQAPASPSQARQQSAGPAVGASR